MNCIVNYEKCCNLCGSSDTRRLYTLEDDHFTVWEKHNRLLNVEKCRECGLVFISNVEDTDKIHETFWEEVVRDIAVRFEGMSSTRYEDKVCLMDQYREKNRVLDIGCGDGRFLNRLKTKGWTGFGIELSPRAVNHARNKLDLNVVRGMAEDMDFPENHFDVVIMWGVIEHLRDPRKVLGKVHKSLRRGGLLLIYTPNVNSLFHRSARFSHLCSAGRFEYPLRIIFIAMHQFYFSPTTISRILIDNELIPFKIYRENFDLNMVFTAYADRAWVRNRLMRYMIKAILVLSSIFHMESHMVVYSVNKKS